MADYNRMYDQFFLDCGQVEQLRHLSEHAEQSSQKKDRLIVETVIIEHGRRRVIRREEQGAELV